MRLIVRRVVRDCCALVCAASLVTATAHATPRPGQGADGRAAAEPRRSAAAFDALPMSFEPNVGQTDDRVKFVARGRGYSVFLTEDAAVLGLSISRPSGATPAGYAEAVKEGRAPDLKARERGAVARESVRLRIEGARKRTRIVAERELPGRSNYLTGSDPAKWRRDVPTYGAVRYEGIYEGVDALFYGTQHRLEYDFVVRPGADPSQIRMRVEGQRAAAVDENGDLVLTLANGEVRQQRALVYQKVGGETRTVGARYALGPGGEVRFELDEYDRGRELVVDPVLVFAAYLGGSMSSDTGLDVALGHDGAIYVTGQTNAIDFPATPGAHDAALGWVANSSEVYDAFVSKLSPNGATLLYSTYLGGTRTEQPAAIAVDASGHAYLTGNTESSDFPTTPGAVDETYNGGTGYYSGGDVFLAKLSADGSALAYSTFLGGRFGDVPGDVGVTASGAAVVAGSTYSFDYPTTAGAFDPTFNSDYDQADAFVTRVAPDGASLDYSTFLGGYGGDFAHGVAVDSAGVACVVGYTNSTPDFPTTAGAFDTQFGGYGDAFVAKLGATGATLVYSTLLGGNNYDLARAVALDQSGAAYVTGDTDSADFPVTPGAYTSPGDYYYRSVFLTKVDASGASLAYSSRFGGYSYDDSGYDVAVDGAGAAYVVGWTNSADFPTTPGAFSGTRQGYYDAFVFKMNAAGSAPVYSTLLGGLGVDAGYGVAVDAAGRVYAVGTTDSPDYPTTAGAFDTTFNGSNDAFVTVLNAAGSGLESSLFLAGSASPNASVEDDARALATDATGALYVTGSTASATFPTTPGAHDTSGGGSLDAFVSKLSADGTALVYSTFIGGSAHDTGYGIAVDPAGQAHVVGSTISANFPAVGAIDATLNESGGYGNDAFAAKLGASGSVLLYSTYLGGEYEDGARAVALGADGSAYVTGLTVSNSFPTTPGAFDTSYNGYWNPDAFVSRINLDGSSLVYSTFLGGGGPDDAFGIAVDAAGAAYVVGETRSPSFPTTPGAFDTVYGGYAFDTPDAFVTKLSPAGSTLAYSTYLGGEAGEAAHGVAVDAAGAAYVVGETVSADFPTTPGAFDTILGPEGGPSYYADAYVTKVNASGTGLAYSTFVGGEQFEAAHGIALDGETAYVTGYTFSEFYPTTTGAYDVTINDGYPYSGGDAFVTAVSSTGAALEYSTYLGGQADERGYAIALGPDGTVSVAGMTRSTDFASSGHGGRDNYNAFVARLVPQAAPVAADTVGIYASPSAAWFLRNENSGGDGHLVFNYGVGGTSFVALAGDWDGDGTDTPGLYDPATGAFFLRDECSPGPANLVFTYGPGGAGISPLVGDWDGDGVDTVGIYSSENGAFFLKNSNAGGAADVVFFFGAGGAGVVPLFGDWDGDGVDSVGLHAAATGAFFLKNEHGGGAADLVFFYGGAGATAIAGDWDGDGTDTVGIYAPAAGAWFLKNENAGGAADLTFFYGGPGATPLTGNWDGE